MIEVPLMKDLGLCLNYMYISRLLLFRYNFANWIYPSALRLCKFCYFLKLFWLLHFLAANRQRRFSGKGIGCCRHFRLLLLGFFGFFVATLAVVAFGHERSFQLQQSCAGMAKVVLSREPRAKFMTCSNRYIRREPGWPLLPQPRPAPFAGHGIWW